ncbi:hypothetical protein CLPU_9c00450 [Gottschalkia purinilytica]|uniref:DUF58 domain-containing protein n=1 Tax=Gottschalkia purinilytica TaxID=1503 RepID=A0A0L0W9D0_GOTPU|nr:DUF58 domain-containing protein [Gottschalkia purinilytica]KNF08149.1 hypothetical protein CLPU_9c00450 [Gottschalkia purinilytica]
MKDTIIESSLIRKLERLQLNTNIVLNKGYTGGRKSNAKGSSVEFSDFREYAPGDDFRKIDWNAYGRFEKLFIKLFMEERQSTINIFLDTTKSMDFGNPKKSLISKQLALVFGYISTVNLDRVHIHCSNNNKIDTLENLSGKNSLYKIIDYLGNIKFEETNDLLKVVKSNTYKKGISIIISDLFTDSLEEIVKYLAYMNQSVIILHTLSREELSPEYIGDVRLIDSETNEEKDVYISSNTIDSYEETLKRFIGNIKEICRKYGCYYSLLSNQISIEEVVFDNLVKAGILR